MDVAWSAPQGAHYHADVILGIQRRRKSVGSKMLRCGGMIIVDSREGVSVIKLP